MTDDDDKIIPIGKYKGQPVEVLQSDPRYADWLTAQPWFRERYAGIYQIIVNNFREPTETPEHNKLQARFLDQGFRQAVLRLIDPAPEGAASHYDLKRMSFAPSFERGGWDVLLGLWAVEIKPTLGDEFPAVLRQIRAQLNGRCGDSYGSFTQHGFRPVLVIDRFDAEGATLDQVRQMFGFPIVTIAEIEAIAL